MGSARGRPIRSNVLTGLPYVVGTELVGDVALEEVCPFAPLPNALITPRDAWRWTWRVRCQGVRVQDAGGASMTEGAQNEEGGHRRRARFESMLQAREDELALLAYRVGPPPAALVPAPPTRAWIEATPERFARRCLPLMMACQGGWFVLNSRTFQATWDGGDGVEAVQLNYFPAEPPYPAISHFGSGIVTFHVPYLFRTPPGWNLLARGPANWPKDGIFPLEGLVETDWATATFTMNWKFTAADRPVTFEAGEPFCMLVPQRRGDVGRFRPEVLEIASVPDLQAGYAAWQASRARFLADLKVPGSEAAKQKWEKHYFRGMSPDGTVAPAHETKLDLKEVDDPEGWCPPVDRAIGT